MHWKHWLRIRKLKVSWQACLRQPLKGVGQMERAGCVRGWRQQRTERVPVQLYDSSVGLVNRTLQWSSKCCWNENHINTADFLPHITSLLPAPPSFFHIPSSLPHGLSGPALAWYDFH